MKGYTRRERLGIMMLGVLTLAVCGGAAFCDRQRLDGAREDGMTIPVPVLTAERVAEDNLGPHSAENGKNGKKGKRKSGKRVKGKKAESRTVIRNHLSDSIPTMTVKKN